MNTFQDLIQLYEKLEKAIKKSEYLLFDEDGDLQNAQVCIQNAKYYLDKFPELKDLLR
jgi:hypothetical protein